MEYTYFDRGIGLIPLGILVNRGSLRDGPTLAPVRFRHQFVPTTAQGMLTCSLSYRPSRPLQVQIHPNSKVQFQSLRPKFQTQNLSLKFHEVSPN